MKEPVCDESYHPMEGIQVFEVSRQMPRLESWVGQVTAFVPVYFNGNITLVLLEDQTAMYVPYRTPWLRTCIARHFGIVLQGLRRAREEDLGKSMNTPLLIPSENKAFVPLKVRNPISRNDGATGFFRTDTITQIDGLSQTHCKVTVSNHLAFHIHLNKQQVIDRVRNSRSFEILFRHRGDPYFV